MRAVKKKREKKRRGEGRDIGRGEQRRGERDEEDGRLKGKG